MYGMKRYSAESLLGETFIGILDGRSREMVPKFYDVARTAVTFYDVHGLQAGDGFLREALTDMDENNALQHLYLAAIHLVRGSKFQIDGEFPYTWGSRKKSSNAKTHLKRAMELSDLEVGVTKDPELAKLFLDGYDILGNPLKFFLYVVNTKLLNPTDVHPETSESLEQRAA